MTEPRRISRPPRSILLATDLSARCDRALDRAVLLTGQWQAELVILHVLEDTRFGSSAEIVPAWRRPQDPLALARRRLIDDVGPIATDATLIIEEGDPAETISRVAETRACDLIVTGVARDEPFGRFTLGTTADLLFRHSPVPVLVVKNRARRPYRKIVVATDFSDMSRQSLEMALGSFPGQTLTVFHAYDPPLSGFVSDAASYRRQYSTIVEEQFQAFINASPAAEALRTVVQPVFEYGAPDRLLRDYCQEAGVDLVVLGSEGRGRLFEMLVGSVAKQIMAELPCDALVVTAAADVAATE